jgi:hypothetical protein
MGTPFSILSFSIRTRNGLRESLASAPLWKGQIIRLISSDAAANAELQSCAVTTALLVSG